MELGDYVSKYRKEANLTIDELALRSGVPKGTINKIIAGTTKSPTLETVCSLATALGKTIDDFTNIPAKPTKAPSLPDEAMSVAKDYWSLDRWGRQVVRSVIADEKERCEDESRFLEETAPPAEEEPKVIPLYLVPAAAGYASPIFGSDFDYYTLKSEDPQGALFAIRVQGDSMEPHFLDGSIAFCNKDPLQDGDIGVFCLDGDSFIKQYHYDKLMGMTYLFSLNRDRADADKLITRTGGQTLTCFGRVMTKRRFPIPGAGGIR